MVDEEKRGTHEVIFAARYWGIKVWFSVIVAFTFPMWLLFYASYHELRDGKYVLASLTLMLALTMLLVALDSIFFKELMFYSDRVVKVWHLFGHRTIYYSTAKVIGPPRGFSWLSSAHQIRETRAGKAFVIQIPILYMAFFFPTDSAKTIGNILDYLTEDTVNNPRAFRKARLTKEVVCH